MAKFVWLGTAGGTESTEADVLSVRFGSGYEQVAPAGINNLVRTWRRNWALADRLVVDQLTLFLRQHKGAIPFDWTTPSGEAVRVRCKKWGSTYRTATHADAWADFEEWPGA